MGQVARSSHDPACQVAHGEAPAAHAGTLVAVFASPVARALLHFGRHLGYRTVLAEPAPDRLTDADREQADEVIDAVAALGADTDVVFTDHHREELADVLAAMLSRPARWIGVMGSPRHPAPYLAALAGRGIAAEQLSRIHRPIGLNIGSKTPAEIAVATLAGLIAERTGHPGGFTF